MIILQNNCMIPLPYGVNDIKSFTMDNCNFYFLDKSGCKLIKWTPNIREVETIKLEQKYLCICYDHRENCFWAIPDCNTHLIYRLDACFCAVGHISIKGDCNQRPISLSCDDCKDGIWICYTSQIAYVEKCNEDIIFYKNENNRRINLDILIQCECHLMCFSEGIRQIMEITSACDKESIEICIPKQQQIIGVSSCFCNNHKNCRFCVLLSKVCSRELMLVEYCIDFSGEMIDSCYPKPCPPEPFPPQTNCSGIYEIMHSIALEEAGISHILNAEGEKIQKAVAISDNIEDLICVNESVKRTVTQITLLEGMLYSKLEAVLSYDNSCNNPKPCPPKPCPPKPCPPKPCPPKPCNKSGGDKK